MSISFGVWSSCKINLLLATVAATLTAAVVCPAKATLCYLNQQFWGAVATTAVEAPLKLFAATSKQRQRSTSIDSSQDEHPKQKQKNHPRFKKEEDVCRVDTEILERRNKNWIAEKDNTDV